MRLGIFSMRDLALPNFYYLNQKLGVRGEKLFVLAWGVDRSILRHRHHIKVGNVSNSQVLPRDYNRVDEIKVVIREIGEPVAARLRAKNEAVSTISLFVGYSYATSEVKHSHGFNVQTKIVPSNQSNIISSTLIQLFDDHFEGGDVRNLGVAADKLQLAGMIN